MALQANALAALDDVKTELGISGSSEDTYLERLIDSASDFIEGWCGRSFYNVSDQEDSVAGFGGQYLFVTRTPLNSITSITFGSDTVDSDAYEIHNANEGSIYSAGGWVWTAEARPDITKDLLPGSERNRYTITYDGGYTTIPSDLEDACIQMVTARYRSKGRNKDIVNERLGSWSAQYRTDGLPCGIENTLARYRRVIAL